MHAHTGASRGFAAGGRLASQPLVGYPRDAGLADPFSSGEDERAAAVVLDSEATSFLMMGALSPGEQVSLLAKRLHSICGQSRVLRTRLNTAMAVHCHHCT